MDPDFIPVGEAWRKVYIRAVDEKGERYACELLLEMRERGMICISDTGMSDIRSSLSQFKGV